MSHRLFDEDEEVREFDLDVDLDFDYDNAIDPDDYTMVYDMESEPLDDDDLEEAYLEGGWKVECRACHLLFRMDEVTVLHVEPNVGTVEFRCPSCNQFRVSDLIIVD